MAFDRQTDIARILRQRIERAARSGALREGDTLPSTRELAREFGADPRVIAAAYRRLASERIVSLRQRSGVYVGDAFNGLDARDSQSVATRNDRAWIVDLLTEGVLRGIPATRLPGLLHDAIGVREVRVAVIATFDDQTLGLCRELTEDFGLSCQPILADALSSALAVAGGIARARASNLPPAARRADLWVTTERHRTWIPSAARRFGKHIVVASVKPDLLSDEWLMLIDAPVYVIARDARFLNIVRAFIRSSPDAIAREANVRLLVAGRDDISRIPPDAPTYVTEAGRRALGRTKIPGRLIPAARVLKRDCVREILSHVVQLGLQPGES